MIKRIETHPWIEPLPDPAWVKRRYLLVEENPDVLVAFTAIHSANNGITISLQARREQMYWFDTSSISKATFAEYVEFLKEQL